MILERLFVRARSVGIHFLFSTQSFSTCLFNMPDEIRKNSGVRVALNAQDKQDSCSILGDRNYAAIGLELGECVYSARRDARYNVALKIPNCDGVDVSRYGENV